VLRSFSVTTDSLRKKLVIRGPHWWLSHCRKRRKRGIRVEEEEEEEKEEEEEEEEKEEEFT
jgi:DNA-directed RNA polymerase specialized sigma24 family protein